MLLHVPERQYSYGGINMDKTRFGSYIRAKRCECGMTQKELADKLVIDVTAVSKWERGVTYPDITMIPDICACLGVSEHELIASSNDTEYRAVRSDAKRYRKIKNGIFRGFILEYAVAVLTCLTVDLATGGGLGWSLVVAVACLCGFTFVPTCTRFVRSCKLSVFVITTLLSLTLLFVACSVYTGNYWWHVASVGTLLGYYAIFFPIMFVRQRAYMSEGGYRALSRFFLLIYSAGLAVLTLLLLVSVNAYAGINMPLALSITGYSFVIAFAWAVVELLPVSRTAKLSADMFASGAYFYFMNGVFNSLLGTADGCYKVDFRDWSTCSNGNTVMIVVCSLALLGVIFAVIAVVRRAGGRKSGQS